jgi:hypothetical protein
MSTALATLWLNDRSRYKLGTGRCARQRYLSYHWGPTGYGITSRNDSLPLATGIYVHEGVAGFCAILQAEDRLPTLEETRAVVAETCAAYVARVEAKGFLGILGGEHTTETITEQKALISGLLWALRLKFLPWLHQTYRVLSAEQERLHFLTCTCGAGPLPPAEHAARGCSGKGLMLRNDIIAHRRQGTTLAYFEVKTTGWESDAWTDQWESDPQLGLGTLDAARTWGAEVTELYIIGLQKGARRRDKNDPEGRRKQLSALCYGYKRPGNPPLVGEDWLPAYEWIDDNGELKRASRAHKRAGIWEIGQGDYAPWRAYQHDDPGLTPEEFWVRMLPTSVIEKVCFLLGPMNRQDHQIASVRTSMIGEEERWQQVLWALYEAQQKHSWESVEYQTVLDTLIPQSWNCRPFGRDHQCEMYAICHKEEGWQDPLGSGHYVPRRPHHQTELDQAVARGLLTEEAVENEGEVE